MSVAVEKRVFWVLVLVTLGACARSESYRQDAEYYNDPNYYSYYYGASAKSPSQQVEQFGQPKKTLDVLNFWNDTPVQFPDLGSFAAVELKRDLANSQRVLLPEKMITQIETGIFVQGAQINVAQLVREGRRMGVRVLILGRISKISFRQKGDDIGLLRQKQSAAAVDLEIKLFDISTGREMMAVGRSGTSTSSAMVAFDATRMDSPEFRAELVRLAIRDAATKLTPAVLRAMEKMEWRGRVAKVIGSRIYVNAGKSSGLVNGDILRVTTDGDDLYDPVTGSYLGKTPGQLKGTLEVVDFVGEDAAVASIHTGGNFQEGDTVRLY